MPFLVVAALVVAIHLVIALGAWTGVGLLADDREMIGGAILRHRGVWTLGEAFLPAPAAEATRALYRPFIDLLFWLEQPWFGIEAFGYHVVNSGLHCTTALLWCVLVRRWSGSLLAGAATALLFVGWPGHSEATHWIAARTNVMSTCLLSFALLAHDRGLAGPGARRLPWLGLGAVLAAVAIGTKESAVFVVPVAAAMAWLRLPSAPSMGRRLVAAGLVMLPMAVATFGCLAFRAARLGTWGSGSHYGWKAQRVGAGACADWLQVMLAPAHATYAPVWAPWLLGISTLLLLAVAVGALRATAARAAAGPALVLLALGYLAGIGLEVLDPRTLENVRYTYEPALGLCVLLGLGVAALPARAAIGVLGGLVVLHAFVLDANRQSWRRVSAVYTTMREQVLERARATQQPVRAIDGPAVYDGAFGLLNGYTEFLFWQQTAAPGTNLRGAVSSALEWPAVLHELAAAAAQKQLAMPTFVVRWDDGALVPLVLDERWPLAPWPGCTIAYARIARERPFAGSPLPVHVLLQTDHEVHCTLFATSGDAEWTGATVVVAATVRPAPLALTIPLPTTLPAGASVAITLRIVHGERQQAFALGQTSIGAR